MTALVELARAKINLSLHVGPVKPNGRHNLVSFVTFADDAAADRLEAEPASSFSLAVTGPFAGDAGPARDNLVLKAARAMNAALANTAPPLAFRLSKQLPCAAGIGGGSADAAAALRLIARAHGGERAVHIAREVAPTLGGDVLACLTGLPGLMSGEGETYEPCLSIPVLPCVLVNPGVACPTGPVFQKYDEFQSTMRPHPTPPTRQTGAQAFMHLLQSETENSLEPPASDLVPSIAETLARLRQDETARLVRMTGSGATCFALFDDFAEAEAAARALRRDVPGWWIAVTMLGAS